MFGRTPSGRSFGAALRDLAAESPTTRASAAEDLARFAESHRAEVVQALIESLEDESATVRAAAALTLADTRADEAVPALLRALDDRDVHVKQMALTGLGEIGGVRARERIAAALDDALPEVRFQAVIAFARASQDRAATTAMLLRATRDDDDLVRHMALRIAEEAAEAHEVVDDAILARAKELLADPSLVVQVAAAVILGRAGRRDGREVLVAVAAGTLRTSEADDEATAIELCGTLELREAIAALDKRAFSRVILFHHDPFAWQARVALAAMKHPRAVEWVVAELGAWNRERRCLAVDAARRARVAESRARLMTMRGDDSQADPDAVEAALAALDG